MPALILAKDLIETPWKNRQGTTKQIAIEPANASGNDNTFEWRLSSAQVLTDCAFSFFPGCDRLLTVLAGEGLLLNEQRLTPHSVHRFRGEESIHCRLLAGPVTDLGLIFRRELWEAHFEHQQKSAGEQGPWQGVNEYGFLFVQSGMLATSAGSIGAGDCLSFAPHESADWSVEISASFFAIRIRPIVSK